MRAMCVIRNPVRCTSATPISKNVHCAVEDQLLCRLFIKVPKLVRDSGMRGNSWTNTGSPHPTSVFKKCPQLLRLSLSHTTVLTDGSDRLSWPVMSVGGYCCEEKERTRERNRGRKHTGHR